MQDNMPPSDLKCHTCGREYSGSLPNFCLTCGTRLEGAPDQGRESTAADFRAHGIQSRDTVGQAEKSRTLKIAIAAIVVVLVIALGVGAAVFALRGDKGSSALPTTAAQMKASVLEAQDYLNSHWKNLAPGRVEGAPVYSVDAKLDTVGNSISGKARILYTNKAGAPLSEIVLRVYANSRVVNTAGGTQISLALVDGKAVNGTLSGSLLHIPLPSGLTAGAEALIEVDFKESIPEVQSGLGGIEQLLGQSSGGGYGVFGRSKNTYDLGYFIPTVAAYGAQGWESRDVPSLGDVSYFDCAYYTVAIDVPGDFVVAAPGVATSGGGSSGRKVYRFRGGPMRDFTAQASPDYQVARASEGETTVSSYYLKGAGDKGKQALGFARQAVKQYNLHMGYYPYTGLNICEAPLGGGAGGMEFSGQVQIAQLLYGDLGSMLGSDGSELGTLLNSLGGGLIGDMLEFTVAHEVCHQWWGLTVGSDSLAHPWQDESLTNYCTVLYFRWAHGAEAAKKQLDMQITMPYSAGKLLGAGGDMIVDSPASSFTNATQYTAIVYSKGALFYEALEQQMGAEAFEKGLKRYYDDYAFRVATPGNLVASFEAYGNADNVAALHRRWILETHADEDIAATIPGMDMLNDLLKDLPGNLDMNNLEDLLKEFMPNGSLPQLPNELLDNGEPILPI